MVQFKIKVTMDVNTLRFGNCNLSALSGETIKQYKITPHSLPGTAGDKLKSQTNRISRIKNIQQIKTKNKTQLFCNARELSFGIIDT